MPVAPATTRRPRLRVGFVESPGARRGVTLLELLIVMTIMLMVTAATIPVILPATQNRRMREAARLASSYISGARSRAIETGRPVGVMLERFNGLPYSMNLSYVEVPPPYAGDTLTSRITVGASGQMAFAATDVLWMNTIRYGDLVRLDFKGSNYLLSSVQAPLPTTGDPLAGSVVPSMGGTMFLVPPTNLAPVVPFAYASNPPGVAFQIFRQPIRSSVAPMQLPEGVVFDLIYSGMTIGGIFPTTMNVGPSYWSTAPPVPWSPVITFAPSGRVDFVTSGTTGVLARPTGPIFLLLGRRELMADASTNGNDNNVFDSTNVANAYLQNFWVAVGYQTGLVTVTENAVNGGPALDPMYLQKARAFAQQSQSLGGR